MERMGSIEQTITKLCLFSDWKSMATKYDYMNNTRYLSSKDICTVKLVWLALSKLFIMILIDRTEYKSKRLYFAWYTGVSRTLQHLCRPIISQVKIKYIWLKRLNNMLISFGVIVGIFEKKKTRQTEQIVCVFFPPFNPGEKNVLLMQK